MFCTWRYEGWVFACVCLCICFHVDGGRWGCMTVDGWMRAMGRKKRERDDEGGIGRVNRAQCGAWYGCVTQSLGVVSAMRLWQPQFAVCLDSEAPPQEQLNNRWQERGSIHRAGHTETYTNTHKVMYAEICAWMLACFLSGLNEDTYTKAGMSKVTYFQKRLVDGLSESGIFKLGSRNTQVTSKG